VDGALEGVQIFSYLDGLRIEF